MFGPFFPGRAAIVCSVSSKGDCCFIGRFREHPVALTSIISFHSVMEIKKRKSFRKSLFLLPFYDIALIVKCFCGCFLAFEINTRPIKAVLFVPDL